MSGSVVELVGSISHKGWVGGSVRVRVRVGASVTGVLRVLQHHSAYLHELQAAGSHIGSCSHVGSPQARD